MLMVMEFLTEHIPEHTQQKVLSLPEEHLVTNMQFTQKMVQRIKEMWIG